MKRSIQRSATGVLSLSAMLLVCATASAYDGEVSGTVDYIFIKTNNTVQTLVVGLEGTPALCGSGTDSFARLAEGETAFSEVVRILTAAKLSGTQVRLYSDKIAGTTNCALKLVKLG